MLYIRHLNHLNCILFHCIFKILAEKDQNSENCSIFVLKVLVGKKTLSFLQVNFHFVEAQHLAQHLRIFRRCFGLEVKSRVRSLQFLNRP